MRLEEVNVSKSNGYGCALRHPSGAVGLHKTLGVHTTRNCISSADGVGNGDGFTRYKHCRRRTALSFVACFLTAGGTGNCNWNMRSLESIA